MSSVPNALPAPTSSVDQDFGAPIEVSVEAFEASCLDLLAKVRDQRIELAVVCAGVVIARVVPPDGPAPSAFGFMRGTVVAHDDTIAPDFEAWDEPGRPLG